ncbi:MAG TPA: CGNR zinc finger domain-containing protein [Candidatus Limnocylindrales bacterium]|nr:CGNR zinc finger domain-containing protein [Candidatus Limnocylindrales bacterium]
MTNRPASRPPHHHHATLEDALDFLNTLEHDDGVTIEHLPTPEAAVAWLAGRGLLHPEAVPTDAGEAALPRIRRVRSALREVYDAVVEERAPDARALATVNRALRAREILELVPGPGGLSLGHRHVGDPVDDALARLIEPLVEELVSGRRDRLRICANEECRWVFLDESPAGRRRWCSMTSCGNRAKVARYRARRKGTPAPADGSGVQA